MVVAPNWPLLAAGAFSCASLALAALAYRAQQKLEEDLEVERRKSRALWHLVAELMKQEASARKEVAALKVEIAAWKAKAEAAEVAQQPLGGLGPPAAAAG